MTDVFISYTSEDRERVQPIVAALRANGWSVWWDRELKPGPSYDREIEKAIGDCQCVVVVWSQHSLDSEWVRVEAGEGMSRGILVPVRIDAVRPPLAYRNRHTADLSGDGAASLEHEYQQFFAAVAETLNQPVVAPQAPPATRLSGVRRWRTAGIAVALVLTAAVALWIGRLDDVQPGTQSDAAAVAGEDSAATLPTQSQAAFDHFQNGRMLMRARGGEGEQLSLALAEFDQALALDPRFADAQAGRCTVFITRYRRNRNQADFEQAEQACFRALTHQRSGESGWEVRAALGDLYRAAGQYDKSLDELLTANRLHPNSAEVQQKLGLTYSESGNMNLADRHLVRATTLEPNNWNAQVALGNFRYDTGNYEAAISTYEKVLSFQPAHPGALIGLGSAMYMLQRYDDATMAWDKAAEVISDAERGSLALLQSNLGLSLYYAGKFAQAAEKQRHAAALAPNDHRIWGRLAESYRHAGMSAEAQQAYDSAITLAERELQLNPNAWETLGLLGLYHAFTNDTQKARAYAQRMLAVDGAEPTAHYFDALIDWSLNDADRAFTALNTAIDRGFSVQIVAQDPDLIGLRERDPARYDALLNKQPSTN